MATATTGWQRRAPREYPTALREGQLPQGEEVPTLRRHRRGSTRGATSMFHVKRRSLREAYAKRGSDATGVSVLSRGNSRRDFAKRDVSRETSCGVSDPTGGVGWQSACGGRRGGSRARAWSRTSTRPDASGRVVVGSDDARRTRSAVRASRRAVVEDQRRRLRGLCAPSRSMFHVQHPCASRGGRLARLRTSWSLVPVSPSARSGAAMVGRCFT